MCYDIKSSLTAWVVANGLALYLFTRNKNYDRWNAGFIAVFSTVQLLEAGIWWTGPVEKDSPTPSVSNELLTKMILLILMLQPLTQSYLGAVATQESFLYVLSFIYLGILLWVLVFRLGTARPGQFYTTQGKRGHLVWVDKQESSFIGGWGIGTLYLAGLFVPLLFAKEKRGLPLILVGGGTAAFSLFLGVGEEFSSLWCYYAVLYALAAVFV